MEIARPDDDAELRRVPLGPAAGQEGVDDEDHQLLQLQLHPGQPRSHQRNRRRLAQAVHGDVGPQALQAQAQVVPVGPGDEVVTLPAVHEGEDAATGQGQRNDRSDRVPDPLALRLVPYMFRPGGFDPLQPLAERPVEKSPVTAVDAVEQLPCTLSRLMITSFSVAVSKVSQNPTAILASCWSNRSPALTTSLVEIPANSRRSISSPRRARDPSAQRTYGGRRGRIVGPARSPLLGDRQRQFRMSQISLRLAPVPREPCPAFP